MLRLMLSDELWSKLRTIMRQHVIYHKLGLRKMVEGMLYHIRVGCPWRDLPRKFGSWNSIFQKFNRWSAKDKLMRIFKSLVQNPDLEREFLDGSYVRAHQHCAGAAGGEDQAIGLSRRGNTTKIHIATESGGLPIEFVVTGGEINDCTAAPDLIEKLPPSDYTIADKGYDSEKLREQIREKSSVPVIPRKSHSKIGNAYIDWCLYKYRHLVENTFVRLKHFLSVATRYGKLKRNFVSILALGCVVMWLPM